METRDSHVPLADWRDGYDTAGRVYAAWFAARWLSRGSSAHWAALEAGDLAPVCWGYRAGRGRATSDGVY